jgi:hypothetical protein
VKQFGNYSRGLYAMATLGLLVKEAVVTNAALDQVIRSSGPLAEVYYIQAANYLSQVTGGKKKKGGGRGGVGHEKANVPKAKLLVWQLLAL